MSVRLRSFCFVAFSGCLLLAPSLAVGAKAKKGEPAPPPPEVVRTTAGITEVGVMGKADYRIDLPANWNHSLVVFYHGYSERPFHYHASASINDQAAPMLKRGYAVIQSGYSQIGWALEWAAPETEELRRYFVKKYGQPRETYVSGGSMGGALTMLTIEQNPKPYAGALDLCGAVGPTLVHFGRRFAFRAAFDYYFPGVMPPLNQTPANYEESEPLRQKILAALRAKPAAADAMRGITGLHTDVDVARMMSYFTYVIADIQKKAGGNPFDNRNYLYTNANVDTHADYALNDGVRRYAADPKALKYLVDHYTPTGRVTKPMLALHTIYDPLIPATTLSLYTSQIEAAGYSQNFVQQYVHREGHCAMSPDEIGRAFDELVTWVHTGKAPQAGLLR